MTFDGTIHLRYDAWNRLSAVYADQVVDNEHVPADLIASYEYAGQGWRISRTAGFETTDYYYTQDWQVIQESNSSGDAVVQYLPSLGYADSPVLRWRDADADPQTGTGGMEETIYYTTDANHNVTALLDPSGGVVESYAYDAYGRAEIFSPAPSMGDTWGDGTVVTVSAVGNEITYASYWLDPATGLFHTDARDYHATLGTWISRDPAGYIDGMSLYGYVRSNPVALTDPTGLCPVPPEDPDSQPEPAPPTTKDCTEDEKKLLLNADKLIRKMLNDIITLKNSDEEMVKLTLLNPNDKKTWEAMTPDEQKRRKEWWLNKFFPTVTVNAKAILDVMNKGYTVTCGNAAPKERPEAIAFVDQRNPGVINFVKGKLDNAGGATSTLLHELTHFTKRIWDIRQDTPFDYTKPVHAPKYCTKRHIFLERAGPKGWAG